ncbi:MAG: hypothetical protein HWE34_03325, partial [Methylocystaceae bacterium]|nr:hypothetical protein [Methylocystaceae bacterium]
MFFHLFEKKYVTALMLCFCVIFLTTQGLQAAPLSDQDFKIAKASFLDAKKKRWDKASKKAVQAKSALPAKFIRWMQIIDPKKDVPFQEIAAFISHNSDWPRQSVL